MTTAISKAAPNQRTSTTKQYVVQTISSKLSRIILNTFCEMLGQNAKIFTVGERIFVHKKEDVSEDELTCLFKTAESFIRTVHSNDFYCFKEYINITHAS